jgi:NAD(P)H-hydrate epimerase
MSMNGPGEPPTFTREQVRAYDKRAVEEFHLPMPILMENAGLAVARVIVKKFPGKPVVILCGPGNNGGDGFVIARWLHEWDRPAADVLFVGPQKRLAAHIDTPDKDITDAQRNARALLATGVPVTVIDPPDAGAARLTDLDERFRGGAVLVDALFGIGLTREIDGPMAKLVKAADAWSGLRCAVDIPSGLDCDTGKILGNAIMADVTVTLVARKRGFDFEDGPEACGEVIVAPIGVPRAALEKPL